MHYLFKARANCECLIYNPYLLKRMCRWPAIVSQIQQWTRCETLHFLSADVSFPMAYFPIGLAGLFE